MQEAHDLQRQELKKFTTAECETWTVLYENLEKNRKTMAYEIFPRGLEALGFSAGRIPDLNEVNRKLKALTGWVGVPVTGLEGADSFYPALARKEFPIGNFIRSKDDLGYTPAPDIFHDLYGHIPFYADKEYADFCAEYGKMAQQFIDDPKKFRMSERFFWFTAEFSLIETPQGRRIFGAGILSSKAESEYALSDKPEVLPFDVKTICDQEFKIDEFQKRLFLLQSPQQLYQSISEVETYIKNS